MNFSNLAFILTDDCNFDCSYCRQKKEKIVMEPSTVKKAVRFFYPFLDKEAYIIFYGGEPLLAFDKIKTAVSLLQEQDNEGEKKLNFSITTNGSLLNDENLEFFQRHGFSIMLSYDGLAQGSQRKAGSRVPTRALIERLQSNAYPGIAFSINSVFTPATAEYLFASLCDMMETGANEIQLSFAHDQPWQDSDLHALENQLQRLRAFLVSYYREKGIIPVTNYRRRKPRPKGKKCFFCDGGRGRMAVTPAGNLWGCLLFHGYLKGKEDSGDFRTYSFGSLDDFIEDYAGIYPRILANYSSLRQDCFFTEETFCFLCPAVENCGVCPVSAAYSTGVIGKMPPWMCGLKGILRKEEEEFLNAVK